MTTLTLPLSPRTPLLILQVVSQKILVNHLKIFLFKMFGWRAHPQLPSAVQIKRGVRGVEFLEIKMVRINFQNVSKLLNLKLQVTAEFSKKLRSILSDTGCLHFVINLLSSKKCRLEDHYSLISQSTLCDQPSPNPTQNLKELCKKDWLVHLTWHCFSSNFEWGTGRGSFFYQNGIKKMRFSTLCDQR